MASYSNPFDSIMYASAVNQTYLAKNVEPPDMNLKIDEETLSKMITFFNTLQSRLHIPLKPLEFVEIIKTMKVNSGA